MKGCASAPISRACVTAGAPGRCRDHGHAASCRPRVVPDVRGLRIPERTLALLRDLIAAHAGMHYDDGRLDILGDRLAPLAVERGFDSLLDYYYLLKYDSRGRSEWPRVMDALSVQETYFWREVDQLRALVDVRSCRALVDAAADADAHLVRAVRDRRGTAVDRDGADEAGWFDRAAIEIHASDASEAALARAARRPLRRARRSGSCRRRRGTSISRARREDEWMVKPELFRRVTSWTRVNIVAAERSRAPWPAPTSIFCRNVFIYFTPATVREVRRAWRDAMPSPGYLCVGAAESLLERDAGFELQEHRRSVRVREAMSDR